MMSKKKFIIITTALTLLLSVSVGGYLVSAKSRSMSEAEIMNIAEDVGGRYGISPEFLASIAWHESRWKPDAGNGSCKGLMQVSSRWHADRMRKLGVTSLNDPYGNMLVAADYLYELFEEYDDPGVVLMKYNGDSKANKFANGQVGLSTYAKNVLEKSRELEIAHGKW